MTRRALAVVAVACMAAFTAASCSRDKTTSTSSDTTTSSTVAPSTSTSGGDDTTTTSGAATTTSTRRACAGIVGSGAQSTTGAHATLVAVRIGRQPCSDRVVFEMREQTASLNYVVERASPPFEEDASGKRVIVHGNAFVRVKMTDASGFDFQTGKESYTGPATVKGVGRVVEARRTGDFEGVLTWIIGLQAEFPFAVQVLSAPERLVIDFGGG